MKKFFCFIFLTIIMASIIILPGIIIDPYNVFHPFNPRTNGIEPNSSYIKMKYILDNPSEYDCFIFGDSLVGALNAEKVEKLTGYKTYNMTRSGGLPTEFEQNIYTFFDNGICPELIIMGIEGGSYLDAIENRYTDGLRCPYEYSVTNPFDFWKIYLNPEVWIKSLKIINSAKSSRSNTTYNLLNNDDTFSEAEPEQVTALLQNRDELIQQINSASIEGGLYAYMDECIEALYNIKKTCEKNNIELIVLTLPENGHRFVGRVTESHYLYFLEELAKKVPFYNFEGLNDYTLNDSLYYDGAHFYSSPLGDAVLDGILGQDVSPQLYNQGFGMMVNKSNIDEFIQILIN